MGSQKWRHRVRPNRGKYEGIQQVPEVGDVIYIPTQIYLSHGVDDIQGGQATVTEVQEIICGGKPMVFVRTDIMPDALKNWRFLEEQQAELASWFGDRKAYPDPDHSPEFNEGWSNQENRTDD
jgi:hypothetical protein